MAGIWTKKSIFTVKIYLDSFNIGGGGGGWPPWFLLLADNNKTVVDRGVRSSSDNVCKTKDLLMIMLRY